MKKKRFELVHCLQDSSIPALTGWLRRSWPLWLADPYVPVKDEDEEGGTDYSLGHLPKRKSPKRMSEPGSRLFPRALRRLLWECYTHSLPWNIEWARRTLRWGDELRWTSTLLLYFVGCVILFLWFENILSIWIIKRKVGIMNTVEFRVKSQFRSFSHHFL